MDLIVLAQIITGTATLVVALVLVYQLRQQHRDSDRELTLDSLDLVQNFRINELVSEDFPELYYKSRINGFSNLNDYEKYSWNISIRRPAIRRAPSLSPFTIR